MVDTLHPPVVIPVRKVRERAAAPRVWRFRFACFHVLATYFLLIAGGLVTSLDAGLAVPDWPLSFGRWIFVTMVGNVFFEHGHRLVAQFVGLLTIVYAIWLWRTENRRWVRWLGVGLLATVIAQGVLGGLTVRNLLPPELSVSHGILGQTFFCMSIATAYFVSKEWSATQKRRASERNRDLQRAAWLATAAVFLQLFLGAVLRHNSAGDFEVGRLVEDPRFPLHAAHWFGAFLVLVAVGGLYSRVRREHWSDTPVRRPVNLVVVALVAQLCLGILAVVTAMQPWIATGHVVTGAFILGCLVFVSLRTQREARP